MMVFLLSFVFFVLFAAALSLGLFIRRRPIKSEDEALADILKDMKCASCHSPCAYAGSRESHATDKCQPVTEAIKHQRV